MLTQTKGRLMWQHVKCLAKITGLENSFRKGVPVGNCLWEKNCLNAFIFVKISCFSALSPGT